jgi:hypothetical protein
MIMGAVLCEGQEHKFKAVNLKLIRNQRLFPQLDCKLPLGFLQVALIKFHHQIQSYYLIMECLYQMCLAKYKRVTLHSSFIVTTTITAFYYDPVGWLI